jgi:hypothetical protein
MMKPRSRNHLLTLSLALLLGVTACSLSQAGGEAPAENPQPESQSAPDAQADSPSSGEEAQSGESAVDDADCTDLNPHPIGASIAADYEVSYEQVMTWFCSGYSFENILIALETSEAVDVPAEDPAPDAVGEGVGGDLGRGRFDRRSVDRTFPSYEIEKNKKIPEVI